MFDLNGFDDEEERLRTILGAAPQLAAGDVGSGPLSVGDFDVPEPQQQPSAATFDLQPPEALSFGQQGAAGLPGYTPPPAAKGPQLMEHVKDRGFNPGDLATLAAILGSLAAGKPEVTAAMAGQYGMDYSRQVRDRDRQNQKIDMYNAELSAKDPELERWKLDQQAQQDYGNLTERKREASLQEEREKRLAQAYEDEANPESALNKGKLTMAEKLAGIRSNADVDEAQRRSDIDYSEQDKLAQLLGRGKYAAPKAAAGGKGGAGSKPLTPEQALKRKMAEAALAGLEDGTVDPLTGKSKAGTPAAVERDAKRESRLVPFDGTEVDSEELWGSTMSTDNIREKIRKDDSTLAGAVPAIQDMIRLRKANGAESGLGKESGQVTGEYDIAAGKVESALGVLKNIGVISPTEAERLSKTIPGIGPSASDAMRIVPESLGGGDSSLGKLEGAQKEFGELIGRARKSYGLRGKSAGASATQPAAAPSTGVTSGGKRLVTMKHSKTGQVESQELSERAIQRALADGWELQ